LTLGGIDGAMITLDQKTPTQTYRVRLEANAGAGYRRELHRAVVDALHRGDRRVVVDCASWAHLDLILLSALVNCATTCRDEGAEFQLENLDRQLRTTIEALGLAGRLELH
jgi:ABC-type transporter Mla MlaB component